MRSNADQTPRQSTGDVARRAVSAAAGSVGGAPHVVDPRDFRDVLAHLPTGVTVVAAHGAVGPVGMAANSVTSVSLEPALVLFCPAKSSTTWPDIRSAGAFCINVMGGHHEEATKRFAAKDADRFRGIDYEHRTTGPALVDAVAWIECELADEHDAGDHSIVVARVVAIEAGGRGDLTPLIFFRGRYGTFRGSGPDE
jgi:3-hydroxy-9,10-secoandrosta-1,3,5(10)-triene-9,17-dione monooxygenase reductase component